MLRPLILATACACSLPSWGGDDDARFKPKAYAPRETLRDSTYRESAYTPSGNPRSIGKRVEQSAPSGRWRLFGGEKKLESKKLADPAVENEKAYKQEKQISVSTIKADPRDRPERKPFTETGEKLTDADFTAKPASREKDPMLAPRQGIKVPE